MKHVFLLKNQHNAYLDKSGNWISEGDSKTLFRTEHKDEIINQKVEISVKQPDIRVESISVGIDEKGKLELHLPKASPKESEEPQLEQLGFDVAEPPTNEPSTAETVTNEPLSNSDSIHTDEAIIEEATTQESNHAEHSFDDRIRNDSLQQGAVSPDSPMQTTTLEHTPQH